MKAVGVIPARYASTRFPAKPLAMIAGKPMLQWVIEGTQKATKLSEVVVATDHEDIFKLAIQSGARAVMTDSNLPSGSDRIYQAIQNENWDIVVNIQGDEPLVDGAFIDSLILPFLNSAEISMATLGALLKPDELENRNIVKIILNENSEAIYFSRFPIPYSRAEVPQQNLLCMKHIGMYAYRKSFLKDFCAKGEVALEKAESLEQLRALFMGGRIHVVPTSFESIGVDVPDDIKKIETVFMNRRNKEIKGN